MRRCGDSAVLIFWMITIESSANNGTGICGRKDTTKLLEREKEREGGSEEVVERGKRGEKSGGETCRQGKTGSATIGKIQP